MGFILHGLDTESYDRTYGDRELIRRIIGYFKSEWKRMTLADLASGRFNFLESTDELPQQKESA